MGEIWNFFKSLGRIAKTFFWDMPIFTIWHAMPIMQGEGGWRTKTAAVLFGVGGVLMLLSFVSLSLALAFDWTRVFAAGGLFFGWGLMFGIPGYFLFPTAGAGDQHLRGAQWMGSGQRQSLLKSGDPLQIKIGGIPIPRHLETLSFLVTGSPGSGKSQVINGMLDIIRARGERVVMTDAGGEAMACWYQTGDQCLNPFDEREPGWNWSPFAEMESVFDAERISSSIIPGSEGENARWSKDCQAVVSAVATRLWETGQATNGKLVYYLTIASNDEIRDLIQGLPSATLFAPGAERMVSIVRGMIGTCLTPFAYLNPAAGQNSWSIRKWAASNEKTWLWIPYRADQSVALKPLMACWVDIFVNSMLSVHSDRERRCWLMMDEMSSLGKIASLAEDALPKGRKFGLCSVIGVQSIAQLRAAYGPDGAQTLMSCFANWVILRSGDAETAAAMSKHLGEVEVLRTDESTSSSDNGESNSMALRHVVEKIMLPSEITNFPPLTGVLCLGEDWPLAMVQIPIVKKDEVIPPFVPKKRPALIVPPPAPAAAPVVQTAPVAAAPSIAAPDLD